MTAVLRRAAVTARGIGENLVGGWQVAADPASFTRWAGDTLRYRQLRVWGAGRGRLRTIRLRPGVELTYRLDRGDIRTVAEVWMSRAYEIPPVVRLGPVRTILDLGANIGLTGVWLARQYGCERLVAVEPVPDNARLARRNLERNGVPATLLEAAVGAHDGTIAFAPSDESTLGHAGDGGVRVPMVSMQTVLGHIPAEARVDLLKLDIEGGEMEILTADAAWLDRVDVIVAEIHPRFGDAEGVVRTLAARGFREHRLDAGPAYGPKGDEFMSCFYRAGAAS